MHEFGIAEEVMAAAVSEADRRGSGPPARIGVRIGPGSSVDEEALRTSFAALVEHRRMECSLDVETVPRTPGCDCGAPLLEAGPLAVCPMCGVFAPAVPAGPALTLAYVECEGETTGREIPGPGAAFP